MVDDVTITGILSKNEDPRVASLRLLDEALARGGKDNVTIIVARYQITSGGSEPAGKRAAVRSSSSESTTDSFALPPGAIDE
jgi:serine/threonine protein phosphatase PrpC